MKIQYDLENSFIGTSNSFNTHQIRFTATVRYKAPEGDCLLPAGKSEYTKVRKELFKNIRKELSEGARK